MRRLPRSLRVLSHRVSIVKVHDLKYTDLHEQQHNAYGLFDANDLVISIDPDAAIDRQKVTLVHETLHACLNIACIELDDEEDVVTRLAPVLFDVIRNNRGLIGYVQETRQW